jgi:hypothetical protein
VGATTTDRFLGAPGDATLTMVDGDVREDMPATATRAEPPLCWSTRGDRPAALGARFTGDGPG